MERETIEEHHELVGYRAVRDQVNCGTTRHDES